MGLQSLDEVQAEGEGERMSELKENPFAMKSGDLLPVKSEDLISELGKRYLDPLKIVGDRLERAQMRQLRTAAIFGYNCAVDDMLDPPYPHTGRYVWRQIVKRFKEWYGENGN